MEIVNVKVLKLTKELFAPYGELIEIPDIKSQKPEMPTERFNFWPKLGTMKVNGEIQVGIGTIFKRPFRFSQMERHLKSQEIMIPLTGTILVPFRIFNDLDPSSEPFSDNIKVFEVDKQHAVILKAGIWHWTPMPLEDKTSIINIFPTGTETNDLYIRNFSSEVIINVEI